MICFICSFRCYFCVRFLFSLNVISHIIFIQEFLVQKKNFNKLIPSIKNKHSTQVEKSKRKQSAWCVQYYIQWIQWMFHLFCWEMNDNIQFGILSKSRSSTCDWLIKVNKLVSKRYLLWDASITKFVHCKREKFLIKAKNV